MTRPTNCRDIVPLVRAVYARPGGEVGCCLHVVMSDGNLEQHFAESALEEARGCSPECEAAAEALAACSRTQRAKVRALLWKRE